MANKPQLLSGARGKIVINGSTVLAFVTDLSIDAPQNVRPIHTFGATNARSIEPLSSGPCTVSIGRVIPVNDSKGKAISDQSNLIALGIEPTLALMLKSDDISIDLIDKVTGTTYASIKNCRFASRSLSLSASQVAQERIQLMGIYDAAGGNTPEQIGI